MEFNDKELEEARAEYFRSEGYQDEDFEEESTDELSDEEYTTLINDLSKECLRLELENEELTKKLMGEPTQAEREQQKAENDAFMQIIRANQVVRKSNI